MCNMWMNSIPDKNYLENKILMFVYKNNWSTPHNKSSDSFIILQLQEFIVVSNFK